MHAAERARMDSHSWGLVHRWGKQEVGRNEQGITSRKRLRVKKLGREAKIVWAEPYNGRIQNKLQQ